MTSFKLQLLAATAAVSALGGAAQAQSAFPAAQLYGAGASLPQTIVRQTADCYGLKSDLAFGVNQNTSGTATAPASTALFDYIYDTPAADTLGNHFNCAGNSANPPIVDPDGPGPLTTPFNDPRIVQPNISILYVSTGSGTGVNSYLRGQLFGSSGSGATLNTAVPVVVSTGYDAGTTAATGFQFAFSDTALSSGNLATYNGTSTPVVTINPFGAQPAADTALNLFGPAIQVPHAIAAVAVAYDPVYAKVRNNGGLINEYRFVIAGARADGSGGLRLTRAQYCGIFNGTITNFNQLPTSVVNKDVNDPAAFDVPIKLVGRSETSGTTSLFTRAIAAQCGTTGNKFGNSENRLPYDASVTISGTAYTGTAGTISPTNSISGAFFNKSTGVLTGTETAGLFGVANGNDGVAQYTNYHPDPSATIGDRTLNGHVAYMSPENALPATLFNGSNGYGLNTASLQVNGTGTTYVGPDAKQATAAFTGIQPPQSKGTVGAYDSTVTTSDRANPLDWVQAASKTVSLAAPTKGYPIVGTTNLLLYTCYSTPEKRRAVDGWVATIVGKTTKDFNNQVMPAGLASDPTYGTYARNALSPMPGAWRNAIAETFLKSSAQLGVAGQSATRLGLRNLWIQDRIPTTPTGTTSVTAGNATVCLGKPGA